MQVCKDTLKDVLFFSLYACELPCQSKIVFRSKKIVLLKVLTFTAAGQLFSQKKEYIIYRERELQKLVTICYNLIL